MEKETIKDLIFISERSKKKMTLKLKSKTTQMGPQFLQSGPGSPLTVPWVSCGRGGKSFCSSLEFCMGATPPHPTFIDPF